ncbi:hypothetical protein [Neoroseomonas soli]|uniref:Uncharacterized protein n=1 Tax=Neoroseomonas soli TaxID=1081025 RepID=A0A9X9X0G1_9PROT|nr:hypothetical protein [Neoroseomonas soli]MBR0672890.1 hypothetical protein [Neoroseomonas soli]
MTPVQILERLLQVNRPAAVFLLGGLAVFAAAAIAVSFTEDRAALQDVAVQIVAFAAIVAVLTFVLGRGTLRTVVGWVVVGAGMVYGAAVFAAGVAPGLVSPPLNPVQCIVRFWAPCFDPGGAADRAAARNYQGPAPQVPPVAAPAAAAAVRRGDFQVVVQFAGSIRREDVRAMMVRLEQAGWGVQGVAGGGQRTVAAARMNEVRYARPEEATAAALLARDVQAANLVTTQIRPVPANVLPARLEVWISR